ncbi:MAG: 50S ribosomal protein L5 [Patescibacteria group bacterium]|nr:50S ribosomal protein L5 [Patescibacteria group bacterium]
MKLADKYQKEILPVLQKELGLKNPMAVPRLLKIAINISAKEMLLDKKSGEKIVEQLSVISGQKPTIRLAKKAIAGFKLRQKDPVGVAVTLRQKHMYDFFEKLVSIVLPRVRDFRGVSLKSFDGKGGYTLGLSEQIVFPEIEYDRIDRVRGLEITVVTSGRNKEETKKLLELLGMPFTKT